MRTAEAAGQCAPEGPHGPAPRPATSASQAVRELLHLVRIAVPAFKLLASASTVPRRRWWWTCFLAACTGPAPRPATSARAVPHELLRLAHNPGFDFNRDAHQAAHNREGPGPTDQPTDQLSARNEKAQGGNPGPSVFRDPRQP